MKNIVLVFVCILGIQAKLKSQEVVKDGDFAPFSNPNWSYLPDYPLDITKQYHRPRTIFWEEDRAVRVNPGQCCSITDLTPEAKGITLEQWVPLKADVPYTVSIGTWQITNHHLTMSQPLSDTLIVSIGNQEVLRTSEITTLAPLSNIPHSLTATFTPSESTWVPLKIRMERWDMVSSSLSHTLDNISIAPVFPCYVGLPAAGEATNLVFITHGWHGNMDWVTTLKDSMETLIREQNSTPQDWQVIAYNWTDKASTALPTTALANATREGECVGELLANRHYASVHAIGHSAGGGLINTLSQKLAALSPETYVHLTFLDAYTPGTEAETFGEDADFSEHYFHQGDSAWLDATESTLTHGHNIDVTALNSSRNILDPIQGHGWPHEWYEASVTNPKPGSQGLGALLSRAAGTTKNLTELYPPGAVTTLLPPPVGDTNEDLIVNHADLSMGTHYFGMQDSAHWQNGDVNGDGSVTILDFILLRNQLQNFSAPPPETPVPEPTGWVLALSMLFIPALRLRPRAGLFIFADSLQPSGVG